MPDTDSTEVLFRPLSLERPPPIREHVLPDGHVGSGVLGVMAWNMIGSGVQPLGPLLALHLRWLEHDPKAAISAWRKVCDELLETNPADVVEQAWKAIWARWMKLDPKAAMKHWAEHEQCLSSTFKMFST